MSSHHNRGTLVELSYGPSILSMEYMEYIGSMVGLLKLNKPSLQNSISLLWSAGSLSLYVEITKHFYLGNSKPGLNELFLPNLAGLVIMPINSKPSTPFYTKQRVASLRDRGGEREYIGLTVLDWLTVNAAY